MYMQENLDVHAGKGKRPMHARGVGHHAVRCMRRGRSPHGTKGQRLLKKLFIRQSVSLLYSYLRPEYRERPSNDPPPRTPTLRRRAAVWAPRDPVLHRSPGPWQPPLTASPAPGPPSSPPYILQTSDKAASRGMALPDVFL